MWLWGSDKLYMKYKPEHRWKPLPKYHFIFANLKVNSKVRGHSALKGPRKRQCRRMRRQEAVTRGWGKGSRHSWVGRMRGIQEQVSRRHFEVNPKVKPLNPNQWFDEEHG